MTRGPGESPASFLFWCARQGAKGGLKTPVIPPESPARKLDSARLRLPKITQERDLPGSVMGGEFFGELT